MTDEGPPPPGAVEERAVDPLELFYDLVFVFAISQLSAHLLHDVTWRGRWGGCALLAVGAAVSTVLPPIATLLLLAAMLVTLAITIAGQAPRQARPAQRDPTPAT